MIFMQSITDIIYLVPILLFSVSIHESFHARVSYWLGDKSQLIQGRMTLDPTKHFDIFGFISMMLVGIGWGRPVIIDDRYFKNKRRDTMLVALSGPLSNLLLALVTTLVLKLIITIFGVEAFLTFGIMSKVFRFIVLLIEINVVLAVFNLLPIPPLDGSKVVSYFLPYNARQKYMEFSKYTFIIILAFILLNLDDILILPVVNKILEILNNILNL